MKEKFYRYTEDMEEMETIKSESEWKEYYNTNINHDPNDCGYPTFTDWLDDMVKMGLLVESVKLKKTYEVTITRTGTIIVEAENEQKALDKVLNMPSEKIDETANLTGWQPSDVEEVDQ